MNDDDGSENTSQKRRQGGRGRPFQPNQTPPGARPWRPGESGNPGGRPRSLTGFRARCRAAAERMLERIEQADGAELTPAMIAAFAAVCDRGGYLAADKSARLLLDSLELAHLTREQRETLIRRWDEIEDPNTAADPDAASERLEPADESGDE